MTKSKIFLILSLSFIFGIFIRSFWNVNLFMADIGLLAAVIATTILYKNKIVLLSGFVVLFFVGGIWLTDGKLAKINDINAAGQNFSGLVTIAKEPQSAVNYQKIIVKTEKGELFLVNANINKSFNYGDELNLSCVLQVPENKDDFDYRMYLAKDGISYLCQSAQIEATGRNHGNGVYSAILKLKNKFNGNISRLVPFPESGLLSGLLLGGSAGLPQSLQDNFSRTGTTHIIAVSGYNVTIVAEYLIWLGIFIGLWRKQAFWFAIFGIAIFVVMCGLPASAVRAGVMGGLLLWAMKNGRLANSENAVMFAAALMLLSNPLLLRWDVGFQLSFLATLGIIYLYPYFETKLDQNSRLFWLWEILFLSLSAQIFVLPIILYNFQKLSLISLVANVLILPIVPVTMFLGFLMATFNFVWTPLATVLAWLAFVLLKYETLVINFLGSLKYAALEIKNFSWIWVAVWYSLLLGMVYFIKKGKKLDYAQPEIDL